MHYSHFISFFLLLLSSAVQAFPAAIEHALHAPDADLYPRGKQPISFNCGGHHVEQHRLAGEGKFGRVYEGYIISPGQEPRMVAIKKFTNRNDNVAREGYRLGSSLHNDHLMRVIAMCVHEGYDYALTEWLSGSNGRDLQVAHQFGSEIALKNFVVGILQGLQAMHSQGIAHRDIKPSNMMVGSTMSSAKTVDFDTLTRKDISSYACGTVAYMSPEMKKLRPYSTMKNDVWAMGVSILELADGRQPWSSPDDEFAKPIWKPKSRNARAREIHGSYENVSSALSYILADVFVPEEKRTSMSALAAKISTLERFRSRHAKRDIVVRNQPSDELDGTVCLMPHGNSTMI